MAVVPNMLTSKVLLLRSDKGEGVSGTVMDDVGRAWMWVMVSLVQESSMVGLNRVSLKCFLMVRNLASRELSLGGVTSTKHRSKRRPSFVSSTDETWTGGNDLTG